MRDRRDPGSGNRRGFLKAGLRACALGGLAIMGTALGLRTTARESGSPGCPLDLPCRRCAKSDVCEQPEAARFREKTEAASPQPGLQEQGGSRG